MAHIFRRCGLIDAYEYIKNPKTSHTFSGKSNPYDNTYIES